MVCRGTGHADICLPLKTFNPHVSDASFSTTTGLVQHVSASNSAVSTLPGNVPSSVLSYTTPSLPTTASLPQASPPKPTSKNGIIAGASIGCLVFFAATAATLLYMRRRTRQLADVPCTSPSAESPGPTRPLTSDPSNVAPFVTLDAAVNPSTPSPAECNTLRDDSRTHLFDDTHPHTSNANTSQTEKTIVVGPGVNEAFRQDPRVSTADPPVSSDAKSTPSTAPPSYRPRASSVLSFSPSSPSSPVVRGRARVEPTGYPGWSCAQFGESPGHASLDDSPRNRHMRHSPSSTPLGEQSEYGVYVYEIDGGVRLAGGPPGRVRAGSSAAGAETRPGRVVNLPPPYSPESHIAHICTHSLYSIAAHFVSIYYTGFLHEHRVHEVVRRRCKLSVTPFGFYIYNRYVYNSRSISISIDDVFGGNFQLPSVIEGHTAAVRQLFDLNPFHYSILRSGLGRHILTITDTDPCITLVGDVHSYDSQHRIHRRGRSWMSRHRDLLCNPRAIRALYAVEIFRKIRWLNQRVP
ncbi:hypothetical protein C8Q80DRAFT_1266956 [Daedaleopsis nitida]|nr:hypothetical protein C8Q80DRAFT_1266956 [Daedaleopsis nitida]